MMKSFFKKLALVMAFAMVVSLAAPAAQAFAADELGIALQTATSKDEVKKADNVAVDATVDYKYYGAPKNYLDLDPTWTSSNPEVAKVTQKGEVTGVKDGVATITIALSDGKTGTIEITVGKGDKVDNSFEATQLSDSKVALTFKNAEVTKAALESALGFYYYIGDFKVEVPLIKSIGEVKDGVAEVELYTTVTDGVTYGFTYGDETAEFKAEIGAVASIYFTYDQSKAFVESYTKLTPVLKNAKGIDITASALKVNGAYVMFTEDKQAENGEYWVVNDTIYFSEVTVAEVKVQYFGGYDANGDAIVGPSIALPVVSIPKPVYGVNFTAAPTVDIATSEDFAQLNNKLAVGDAGFNLYIKTKDNENNDITSTNNSRGTWRFESTNVSRLYVTADGLLMPNAAGPVTVLVYYKANVENAVETLVAAVALTVSPARATANVTLDKTSATVSTVAGYNTATFKVTLTDALGQARPDGQKVTVKTTTNVATAAAKPDVAGEADGEVDVYTTGGKGEVSFTVTASDANIASGSTSGVQTYNFTVTSNNITRSFSVTIKAPQYANGAFVASGYKLTTGGATNVKVTDNANLKITAKLALLSSGVPVSTQNFNGAKPANAANAVKDGFYYAVTKNGTDITSNASVVWNNAEEVDIVLTKPSANTVTVASGTAINYVDKTQGVGTYRIVVYQAVTATGATTPSSFKTITSATVTVTDSQDTASYGGKLAATASSALSAADVVKNCFKFTVGSKTYDSADDYSDAYVVVNANTVTGGNVMFVNSVDLYKATDSGVYIKYTLTVNDYVTLQ